MLIISVTFACGNAFAEEKADKKILTETERARINSQVEALKKSKMDEAANVNQNTKTDALRQGKAVDEKLKQQHQAVDDLTTNNTWLYGKELMHNAGQAKKQELDAQAQAEKDKIAKQAREKAEQQLNAAKKSAQSINQTVEGLKSQVSKDGKFGLQPKESNLHIRTYGKN